MKSSNVRRMTVGRRAAALPPLLALAFLCWGNAGAARADNIDEQLLRKAPKLMEQIYSKGYRNVGVLSFRLEKGHSKASFHGGMIVTNMADRVQDAMIVAMNPEKAPLGVADRCSAVAGKKIPKASYRTADDRQRLFSLKYPLAWGTPPAQVSVDAFLTGKVQVSPDLNKVTVNVEAFDRKDPAKMVELLQFTVKMDHVILADIGQGYTISRGQRRFHRGPNDTANPSGVPPTNPSGVPPTNPSGVPPTNPSSVPPTNPSGVAQTIPSDPGDIVVTGNQSGSSPGGATGGTTSGTTDSTVVSTGDPGPGGSPTGPITLKIYYDGVEQPLQPDPSSAVPDPMNFAIKDPGQGQHVTFGLRNNTSANVGLVLVVNDTNTLYGEKGQPEQMSPWILEPNKEYLVKGFHQRDNQSYTPIVGLSDAESMARFADLGGEESAGIISVYIMTTQKSAPAISTSASSLSRSMRRPSPKFLPHGRPKTPGEAAKAIVQSGNARASRGLMAADAKGTGQEQLQTIEFQRGTVQKHMVIKYWLRNVPGAT